jgi:hypothetical protein
MRFIRSESPQPSGLPRPLCDLPGLLGLHQMNSRYTLWMVDNDLLRASAQAPTADRWHSAAANWNSALTQALVDRANLRKSCLVVDVTAGSGDPALSIAQRLGCQFLLRSVSSCPYPIFEGLNLT